jgi:hypothetical protein
LRAGIRDSRGQECRLLVAEGPATAAVRIIDVRENKMVAGASLHDQPIQQVPKPMAREIAVQIIVLAGGRPYCFDCPSLSDIGKKCG